MGKHKRYGTESLSFFGPNIWVIQPDHIKSSKIVHVIKTKIKK